MTDFENQHEAVSSVIKFYSEAGYDEALLTALAELLTKFKKGNPNYDELALYFDKRLQAQNIYYNSAQVFTVMMHAMLKFLECDQHT